MQGQLNTCLPNGLSSACQIFTKVLKPVFAELRKIGHSNVEIKDIMELIDSVGLTTHPEK